MSGYKGHIAGSIAVSGIVVLLLYVVADYFQFGFLKGYLTPDKIIPLVALSTIFTLFPDIDTKSKGQQLFYWLFFLLDLYLILMEEYQWAALLGLFIILPILSKHRGWTHWRITALLVPLPFLLYPSYLAHQWDWTGLPYYLAAVTGYLTHLLFDKRLL